MDKSSQQFGGRSENYLFKNIKNKFKSINEM